MEFRECTIGGTRYGDNGFSPESEGARGARLRKEKEQAAENIQDEETQLSPISPSADQEPSDILNVEEDPFNGTDEKQADTENKKKRKEIIQEYESAMKQVFKPTYSSLDPNRLSFADPQLFKDFQSADIDDKDSKSSRLKEFFMVLALCHTVVIERIGKDGKVIENEEEDEDEDVGKDQPKICTGKSEEKIADSVGLTVSSGISHQEKKTNKFKLRVGGGRVINVPRLSHLKKSNKDKESGKGLKRSKSRGEEFNAITEEKHTSDKVDGTVQTQLDYKAESPDEAALVNAAKNAGFAFIKRKNKMLTVDILGKEYEFELLNILDFNSDRKRMSVILRRPAPWNDIVLYCKGADNVISERLDKDGQDSDIVEKTFHDVNAFSENGLRTLLLSYRVLNKEEYENWKKEIDEASTASEKRAEKIADAQEKIEVNLKLLGATGIEDKLQEGVPQCIEDLRKAGIKIWVLTGDKLETAINIGYASNLLDGDMRLWTVRGGEDSEKVLQCLVDISNQLDKIEADQDNDSLLQENALIIEGSALIYIFETAESKEKLLDIAIRCKSVVCCRVSPLQKALVVQLVRKYHNVVTLAVGDGANDVSMIQVANVGVGIAGQEGVQAAMAADYAIAQFRFLHKLLLVQGHWSYSRISEMILTFFYKNVFWVFPSLWFQIYSGWSGNIFYDYSFLQLYNVVFTVAPVVILGK
jgi:phospholipid-translocating ATPase